MLSPLVNMRTNNIYLIGPMGAGKSTIGRMLSVDLGMEFKDTDREIEDKSGANIPWIFDMEGERGFRERESATIEELTRLPGLVLATGGGAILSNSNRTCLKARGVVVFLQTSVDSQLERTLKDKNRPLLQTEKPREILEKLLKQREPYYLETADIIISADDYNPKAVVQQIICMVERLTDPLSF